MAVGKDLNHLASHVGIYVPRIYLRRIYDDEIFDWCTMSLAQHTQKVITELLLQRVIINIYVQRKFNRIERIDPVLVSWLGRCRGLECHEVILQYRRGETPDRGM